MTAEYLQEGYLRWRNVDP